MSKQTDAAVEAAQHVVDEVTSYEYSAESQTIEDRLDAGLAQAGVRLDDAERARVVAEITALKENEDGGTPQVRTAIPAS